MRLTPIEAVKLIQRGEADEYIKRFVGAVQAAVFSKNPIAISLDDALVASLVLVELAGSAEGRKVLKRPKRKNTQYKAEDFGLQSPQRKIAREVINCEIFYNEALNRLEASFDGGRIPDRDRTLKRLLDDLIVYEESHQEAIGHALAMAGWDGSEETKKEAVKRFLSAFVPGATGAAK